MKKTITIKLLCAIIIVFTACSTSQYDGWKTINIDNCGALKIPEEWLFYEENGFIYFTDVDANPIMIQTFSYSGIDENQHGKEESNKFFSKVINIKTLTSAVLSNGAIYGKALVEKDDCESEKYYLELGYERKILLIIWEETLNDELVKKIARSFVAE